MTDRREEENIREEIRRSQAAPRRGKRVLTVILTLVVVLAVVVAAAWKDLSSLDSVRRLFSYNKVQQDEQGKAELYSFSNDRSNTFALLGARSCLVLSVFCRISTCWRTLFLNGSLNILDIPRISWPFCILR